MTTPAKRQQIFQSVVSGSLGRCHAIAVDVVDVKIIFAAAVLACVLVALQSGFAVASKVIIVAGLLGVLLQPLFVRRKPFVNALNFCCSLARRTTMLGAGFVFKVIAAFWTHQDRSDWGCATGFTQFPQVRNVGKSAVLRLARFTNLLTRIGWLIFSTTHGALAGVVRHVGLQYRNILIIALEAKA